MKRSILLALAWIAAALGLTWRGASMRASSQPRAPRNELSRASPTASSQWQTRRPGRPAISESGQERLVPGISVFEHDLAQQADGRRAVAEDFVVELFQRESGALLCAVIVAEF